MASRSDRTAPQRRTGAKRLFSGLLPILLLLAAEKASRAAEYEQSTPPIGKGVFLIATPSLADPNFYQAVVLICEHGPEGTLGLIINRPTDILLSQALPRIVALKGTSYVLFTGGPVQASGVLVLFRVNEQPVDTRRILEGIYLGGDIGTLERIITKPQPTETFRAYAGYAGWAPGQLESEMAMGAWVTLPADSFSIFDKDPARLWPDSLSRLQAPRVIRVRQARNG